MSPTEHAPGFEFTPDDAFIVTAYSAHATMVTHDGADTPATPVVMLELEGFSQSDLPITPDEANLPKRSIRILLEKGGAEGITHGILNSLDLLDALRRNQERR